MINVAFVWILHQSSLKPEEEIKKLEEDIYNPFLEILSDYANDIRSSFVITGSFLDYSISNNSSSMQIIMDIYNKNSASILPTLYYYPIMTEVSPESIKKNLEFHINIMSSLFKEVSSIFYPPYLVFLPKYSKILREFNIAGTLIDYKAIESLRVPVLVPWKNNIMVCLPTSTDLSKRVPWDIDGFMEGLKAFLDYPKEPLIIIVKNVENMFIPEDRGASLEVITSFFEKLLDMEGLRTIKIDDVFSIYKKALEIPASVSVPKELFSVGDCLDINNCLKYGISKPLYCRLKVLQRVMEKTDLTSLMQIEDFYPILHGRGIPYYRFRYLQELAKKFKKVSTIYGPRILESLFDNEEIIIFENKRLSAMINKYGFIFSLISFDYMFDLIGSAVPDEIYPENRQYAPDIVEIPPYGFLEFFENEPQIPNPGNIEIIKSGSREYLGIVYSTKKVYVEKVLTLGVNSVIAEYLVKKNPHLSDEFSVRFTLMLPLDLFGGSNDHALVLGYNNSDFEISDSKAIDDFLPNNKWLGLLDQRSGVLLQFIVDNPQGMTRINASIGDKSHKIIIVPKSHRSSELRFKIDLRILNIKEKL